jgi:hypothetical protein
VDGFRRGLPGLRTVTSVVDDPECGFWDNEFFGNLDGIALYTLISSRRPSQYVGRLGVLHPAGTSCYRRLRRIDQAPLDRP